MRNRKSIFQHRFGPVAVIAMMVAGISFITRVVLMIKSWSSLELTLFRFFTIYLIGLLYDLTVSSFFAIPVAIYCWLMKDSWYQKKWQRLPLFLLFSIICFILVTAAGSEIIFWNEFTVRFNFIAVDYLIYTNEVLENIWESYNMPLIISLVVIVVSIILFLLKGKIVASQQISMRFLHRTIVMLIFSLLPLSGYFLINNQYKIISNNNYVNELGGNGIYEFGAAFWNNEIDYHQFYIERNDTANFTLLRSMLQAPNATFAADPLSIERVIKPDSPRHHWNVVLISVESLSGDYMKYFGNKENITPYLDSLIPNSLFFSNFYASGTRTVRGLEALTLAIPPTPGQSIVRRPKMKTYFHWDLCLRKVVMTCAIFMGGTVFLITWVIFLVIMDIKYWTRVIFLNN
jgi:phosphoglycerol transferase MdoB-like AlkP superfamily enzyme